MIIIKRITPYWATMTIAAALCVGLLWPDQWRFVLATLVFVPIVQVGMYYQPNWRLEYIGFSVPFFMLLLTEYSFLLMQESTWLIYSSIVVTVILFFLFSKNIAVFLFQPAKYIPYSLEHISTYSNLVTSWFLYVSAFTFFILGVGRLRYMLLATLLGTMVIVWQTFWIQKITWQRAKWYSLIISVLIVELVWALHFWPVSYFTSGILLTIALYMLLHLSRKHLGNSLTVQSARRYIIITSLTVILILVTTQWV